MKTFLFGLLFLPVVTFATDVLLLCDTRLSTISGSNGIEKPIFASVNDSIQSTKPIFSAFSEVICQRADEPHHWISPKAFTVPLSEILANTEPCRAVDGTSVTYLACEGPLDAKPSVWLIPAELLN